jgi:energy-coupling factor transporter ATP-binding protein EcfA2
MIHHVRIENFKSVEKLTLELGRVNVFIGENGSGKSNVLEAIAFATAAAQDKLDNEFLAARGIRVTEPRFMRAAFEEGAQEGIRVALRVDAEPEVVCDLRSEETPTPRWVNERADADSIKRKLILQIEETGQRAAALGADLRTLPNGKDPEGYRELSKLYLKRATFDRAHDKNPSLKLFVDRLKALGAAPAPPEEPAQPDAER